MPLTYCMYTPRANAHATRTTMYTHIIHASEIAVLVKMGRDSLNRGTSHIEGPRLNNNNNKNEGEWREFEEFVAFCSLAANTRHPTAPAMIFCGHRNRGHLTSGTCYMQRALTRVPHTSQLKLTSRHSGAAHFWRTSYTLPCSEQQCVRCPRTSSLDCLSATGTVANRFCQPGGSPRRESR